MSKKEKEKLSNQSLEQEKCNFSLTGISNSRLNRHTMYTLEPKISFDRMTIVHLKIEIMLLSIDKSIIMVYMDI